MNDYTIEQLSDPLTYENDTELEDFARSFAGAIRQIIRKEHGNVDEFALVMSGEYASRVYKSWHKKRDKMIAAQEINANLHADALLVINKIETDLPAGVTVTVQDDVVSIAIPRDGGIMTPKIKRLGGWWDNETRKFIVPLEKAGSLPRIIKNWEKAYNKKSAEIAEKIGQTSDGEKVRDGNVS